MRERVFQGEIEKSFRLLRGLAHYQKIPDSFPPPPAKCWKCGNIVKPKMTFTPPKPYDGYAVVKGGWFLAIEFKMLTTGRSWSMDLLNPNQVKNLLEVARSGGYAWIWINYRTKEKPRYNEVFCLTIDQFLRYRSELDRKSIPLGQLMEECCRIERFRAPDPVVTEYCRHFGYKDEKIYRNFWDIGKWLAKREYLRAEPNLMEIWNIPALMKAAEEDDW